MSEIPAAEAQFVQVPINPDGTVGTFPEPVQKAVDHIVSKRLKERETRTPKAPDPVEAERLKTLETELEQYRIKDAEAGKRYEEAIAIREAREKAERERLQAEIDRRTERLKRSVQADIQAAALRAGAREESLDELATLLSPKVSLNDDLDPVVDGADSIDALVGAYLEARPHHRKAPGGQAMGVTGGVMTQTGGVVPKGDPIAAIQADIQKHGLSGKHLRALREAKAAQAS